MTQKGSIELTKKAVMLSAPNDLVVSIGNLEQLVSLLEQTPRNCYREKKSYTSKEVPKGTKADAIGHSTILADDIELDKFRNKDGEIQFARFAESFFGIRYVSKEWLFLFDSKWQLVDDSPSHCAMRIKIIIENERANRKQIA